MLAARQLSGSTLQYRKRQGQTPRKRREPVGADVAGRLRPTLGGCGQRPARSEPFGWAEAEAITVSG